jgi:Ion channel
MASTVLFERVGGQVSSSNQEPPAFYAGECQTSTWLLWSWGARRLRGNQREFYLGYFGPLSLIVLFILWANLLIMGFTLLQWGMGSLLNAPEKQVTLGTYLYMSGVTFTTLGFGDVVPLSGLGRLMAVLEAGTGFGFLALVIGYVPVIYQAFSRRETHISLLDAPAGSPSSATELLRRQYRDQRTQDLGAYLQGWEQWSAEVLESHLSYPILTYYRSQHERQSWLAALTTILDTCALLITGFENISLPNARFTFAIARHAAVDLAQIYGALPLTSTHSRLPSADFARMSEALAQVGLHLRHPEDAEARLAEIRLIYEPFVTALANHLLVNLPPWITTTRTVDDWQTSAWDHFAQWSPEKIEEITHIIVDHRKKGPVHATEPRAQAGPSTLA